MGGKRIGYGARAINNGTPQALPKLVFPGGALVGCDAGFLNAARSHAAIKSGMLCAEAIAGALTAGRSHDELSAFPEAFEQSWLKQELDQQRNFKLWFKKGPRIGQAMTGVEQWLLPKVGITNPRWTLHNTRPDHVSRCCRGESLKKILIAVAVPLYRCTDDWRRCLRLCKPAGHIRADLPTFWSDFGALRSGSEADERRGEGPEEGPLSPDFLTGTSASRLPSLPAAPRIHAVSPIADMQRLRRSQNR